MDVAWDDGVLDVSAEHEDEASSERRTYHRRFRFPRRADDEEISAQYDNGILEVRLPVTTGTTTQGKQIESGA